MCVTGGQSDRERVGNRNGVRAAVADADASAKPGQARSQCCLLLLFLCAAAAAVSQSSSIGSSAYLD